ncbi:transcriptional repressor [Candidatus Pelagibacter sp.]|nr:transcriptional repressor [Candidatus Pelagibacter sp.]MDC2968641.1 transcriptional repressor [Candidatus Pelagibacter sp.]|tara:strand:- start:287 stop:706 length:420 start_codon:yes stop_codon:yes gene_type:complete
MTTTVEFINKLRNSGLRPTKQRIKICEVLFNKETTFHFTINDLVKIIETEANEKISLATVYNTIHAFEKKGYLKEIPIDSNQSYFDTNVTDHHHFYDISEKKLIDLDKVDVGPINIQKSIPGKKIKSVEVLVKLDTDNQ